MSQQFKPLPFLILPTCLPGLEDEKNKIFNEDRVVPGRYLPLTIVAYHESYFKERTMIYLQNGQPFILELTVEQYEEKITQYMALINGATNNSGIIKKLH